LEEPGVDGRIIIKFILHNYDGRVCVWTAFILIAIQTSRWQVFVKAVFHLRKTKLVEFLE